MEQRLIDANALKRTYTQNWDYENCIYDGAFIVNNINEQPTIDAEPVRHGKWIGYAGTIGNECSVCGKWIDVLQGTAEMNYCPNCGARMDAERKEE